MKCSDVRPVMDLLCDGALENKDTALVIDHLKSCDECQCEWHDLEQLRGEFNNAKAECQLPTQLMRKISQKLKHEERSECKRLIKQYARSIPTVAIAATIVVVGFLYLPWFHRIDTALTSTPTASADTLVADLLSERGLEPVTNRNELAQKVGYNLTYVRLPQWQMSQFGLWKSHGTTAIARFDFVRKEQSGDQQLTCYQAPQGAILAKGASLRNLDGKHVLFGSHDKFQFALWSQKGHDYLLVTPLSKLQLEEIVRGA